MVRDPPRRADGTGNLGTRVRVRHHIEVVGSRVENGLDAVTRLAQMPDACVIIPHSVRSELRAVLRAAVAHGEGRPIGDNGNLDPDERCALRIPSVDFMRNHLARIADEDEVGASVVVEVGISEADGRIPRRVSRAPGNW